jgi:hypothetical protein
VTKSLKFFASLKIEKAAAIDVVNAYEKRRNPRKAQKPCLISHANEKTE